MWVVVAAVAACMSGWSAITPPVALGAGLVLALVGLVPRDLSAQKLAKLAIQCSVVLLGLGMDLTQVLRAGAGGLVLAAVTIVGTLLLGAVLGRMLRTEATVTALVSSGTAICGGSAIAAVGSVIGASAAAMGVAMGTVFVLNAIAVLVFPHVGQAMHMTAAQFGTWAAIAVHDIAGVAGAADGFDRLAGTTPEAVTVATAVKLARTLWIIPLTLWFGWMTRREGGAENAGVKRKAMVIPWFIGLFVVAAAVRTVWPGVGGKVDLGAPIGSLGLIDVGKRGMLAALLLIGLGLSVSNLRAVGWRALALGAVLWVVISAASLVAVRVLMA